MTTTSTIATLSASTMALSLGSIALLLALGRWVPSIPGPLVVVAVGIALTVVAHLPDRGVALIPEVPRGLPLPALPNLDHLPQLIPGALAIAIMAFLETVAVARSVRRSDEPRIDADRELLASSLAALAGSFFRALPSAGGFSQTLVNVRAGARSQVAGLVIALLAVLVALFLALCLAKLPQAVLAAMVFVAVLGLVDLSALRLLYRFEKQEFALAAIVAVLGLTTGLLAAVAGGVLLTLYSVLREANRTHTVQLVNADGHWLELGESTELQPSDPLVVRTRVGLYTANLRANTDHIRGLIADCSPRPRTLVWDLSYQPMLTSTVLDGLREAEADLDGIRVVYAGLPADIHATAQRWPWWRGVESEGRYFPTVEDAVRGN